MWQGALLAHEGRQNLFLYNYYLLPASLLFFCTYFGVIFQTRVRRRVVWIIFTINVTLLLSRIIFFTKLQLFDSIGFSTLSISIVILSFMFFQQLLNQVSESSIFANFNFWVVCGYFISFSASFLVFLTYYYLTQKISANYVYKNRYILTLLWGIPNIMLFISSLLTLTGSLWTSFHKKS